MDVIERKTDSRQLEKYRQYVDEMERVTRLLLLLAGRLARLDNSVLHLPPSGDSQPTTPVFLFISLSNDRHFHTTFCGFTICTVYVSFPEIKLLTPAIYSTLRKLFLGG